MELKRAKELLATGRYTCVVCCGDMLITSEKRGVAPLLEWYDSAALQRGFSAADRAVGKAPACLYVLMGARAVYAKLMTADAAEIFDRYGVQYECELCVPMIRNRADTGFCPVELAVKDLSEPLEVVEAARRRLEKMK